MNRYIAEVEIDGKLEEVEFITNGNPLDYLWQRYGLSTYIASVQEQGVYINEVTIEDFPG